MTLSTTALPGAMLALTSFFLPPPPRMISGSTTAATNRRPEEHCCGNNDCFSFKPEDVKITAAGYSLPSGEVVPFSEAQQSEDGAYWRCKRYDGSRRCFFAAAGELTGASLRGPGEVRRRRHPPLALPRRGGNLTAP